MKSREYITLTNHEIGLTKEEDGLHDINIYGGALVDAGYHGHLTYLVFPQRDTVLGSKDQIALLLRENVPSTDNTYTRSLE